MSEQGRRLAAIRARIEAAELAADRPQGTVNLIAVSKTFGPEAIVPLLEAGHRHFGENRVQEAKAKWPALRARFPGIVLHLIGPLQSNKAREAVELFDCIHTVDRPKIANTLAAEMVRVGKPLPLFVEVNVGAEPQKAGVDVAVAGSFVSDARDRLKLDVVGLMCIPPAGGAPDGYFKAMAKLGHEFGLPRLSMGMSADFEAAIHAGATDVRVGSALFGGR